MSKLVIFTQVRENYGAHDWDGKGECPQYWKFKGGHTYVVENLTSEHINRIAQGGIPTLSALVECKNESWEEYILEWNIVGDSDTPWEEWESPTEFYWGGDRWLARCVTENDGDMRHGIVRKLEQWIPLKGGDRSDYSARFDMADGENIAYSDLSDWFAAEEAAA